MKAALLLPFLALSALLLGQGGAAIYQTASRALTAFRGRTPREARPGGASQEKPPLAGVFAAGNLLNLCLAGFAHLAAVLRSGSLASATRFYAILLIAAASVSYLALLIQKGRSAAALLFPGTAPAPDASPRALTGRSQRSRAEKVLLAAVVLLGAVQLAQILFGSQLSVRGDITAETVGSLLSSEALYSVNPMTGLPYAAGLPTRLKLLCLPTFYAMLCRVFGVAPRILVYRLMPAYWDLCGLCAYGTLARVLFPGRALPDGTPDPSGQDKTRRLLFLLAALLLLWGSDLSPGLDGFGVLRSGWRAETLRAWILVPFLLASLLDRKVLPALLAVLAEGLILWTLFGTGTCLLICAGIALTGILLRRRGPADAPRKGGDG